ncbi:MAG TPA: tyrosine-type recombinase/integrase [Ktedonobacteraceae bacterium]|nr:tyrosine-type recombinase/integrase [Ktedonobacteraceae bacterium]
MDEQNALIPVQKRDEQDVQVISAWLFGKSKHTQKGYRRVAFDLLSRVGKTLRSITLFDVQEYISSLTGEAGTIAYATNAIKSLYSFTSELRYTDINIGKGLKPPKVRSELAQRILTETEVIRLIDRVSSRRDHALLRLLYHAGLRVSEVVGLKWEDIRDVGDSAVISVWGKGEKQRYVPISQEMYTELNELDGRYLGKDRYVFQSRKSKGGTLPMDTRQVERIVLDAARNAGISGDVSPHWLRHSNASHALDNGAPVHVVKESLGHASLVTTTKYAHIKPGAGTSQYLKI